MSTNLTPEISEIFHRLRQSAEGMRRLNPGDEEVHLATIFMTAIYDLGRAVHLGQIAHDDPSVQAVVAETAEPLRLFHTRLQQYISKIEFHLLTNQEEGLEIPAYVEACRGRSAVEFLHELYASSAYADYLLLLDTQDLDNLMNERGQAVGWLEPSQVSEGIPAEHDWWFLDR